MEEQKSRRRRQSTRGAVTIQDVALRADLSTATVSRALANPDIVSPRARERVLRAVAETGYMPNVAARNLRARKSLVVLVVVPNVANAVFAEVVRGIDDELVAAGYGMIIGNLDNQEEREGRYVDLCASGQVDGVLLMTGRVPGGGHDRDMAATGLPMVSLCSEIPETAGPSIVVNNMRALRRIVDHLHDLGHRRFGYGSGPKNNLNEIQRFAGYVAALEAHGVRRKDIHVWPGLFDMRSGVEVGHAFLALPPHKRPTAIFHACDALAIGFMKTVMAAGVRVPEDVSVAGFDGIEYAAFYEPTLTTIRQPFHEIGRVGTRLLLDHLRGRSGLPTGLVEVGEELVIGNSTGPAAARASAPVPSSRTTVPTN